MKKGLEKGLAEGLEKGASEKALAIARKLLAMHMPMDNIKDVTGLTDDELNGLI